MSDMQQPYFQQQPKQRSRWWIPFAIIISLIGGMFLGIILLGVGVASFIGGMSNGGFNVSESSSVNVKENSVLFLNFGAGLREYSQNVPSFLAGESGGVSLLDALAAIKAAKYDDKIKGLYFKPSAGTSGFAKSREVISAIEDFKASGKFFYAFLPGGAERDYYFASLADSIFMPQEASFEFNGFGGSSMFLKNLFDKLGVEWTVIQREDYKSAGEMFNRTKFSDPARQEVRELIDQRYTMFVRDVAKYRKLSETDISAMLQRGVYDPDSLFSLKLIDGFATELQIKEKLKARVYGTDSSKKNLNLVGLTSYASYARSHNKSDIDKKNAIAIVYGSGAIRSGKRSGLEEEIASGSWVSDLRKAAEDDDVKAIILRIDSPGGSVQASDEMYQEILRAKAKKPVYASMSDVAASGGYYMSMACDSIIAYPETITGSIGVIAAIPNLSKTMDKIGVSIDTVTTGKASLFMNPLLPMGESDKKKLEEVIQSFYQRFLERVADGRHSTPEKIREVARGRVWTGEAAKSHGLVDVLGGLYSTIDIVKKRIGIQENKRVKIVLYPEKEDPFKQVLRMLNINTDGSDDEESDEQIRGGLTSAVTIYVQAQNPAWQQAWKSLPQETRSQLCYALNIATISRREQVMATLPWVVDIH